MSPVGQNRPGSAARSNSARVRSRMGDCSVQICIAQTPNLPRHRAPKPTFHGSGARPRKARNVRGDAGDCLVPKTQGSRASLQEWTLKVKLKVCRWTDALGEKTPQMFCGLEQRIGLRSCLHKDLRPKRLGPVEGLCPGRQGNTEPRRSTFYPCFRTIRRSFNPRHLQDFIEQALAPIVPPAN